MAARPTQYQKLSLQLDAENKKLKAKLADTKKRMGGLGNTAQKLGGMLAGAFAVGAIVEFGKEASKLAGVAEGVQAAFMKLNRPQLLHNLKKATRGTVSDLELMKNAVKAQNFKVPLDKLASFFEFATKRSAQTGESVKFLVDSIVNGIGRKSTLVMDNLGISAAELQQEIKKTGDFGKAAGNIIERELAKAGDVAVTTAQKTAAIGATWDNLKVKVGDFVNKGLNLVAPAIMGMISSQKSLSEQMMNTQIQMNAEIDALKSGNITGEARKQLINKINTEYAAYLPNLITEETSLKELNKLQEKANELLFEKIKLRAQEEILADEAEKVFTIQQKLLKEQIQLEKMRNTEVDKFAFAMKGAASPAAALAKETEVQAAGVEKLVTKLKEAQKAFAELKGASVLGGMGTAGSGGGGGGGGGGSAKTDKVMKNVANDDFAIYAGEWDKQMQDFTPFNFNEFRSQAEAFAEGMAPISNKIVEMKDDFNTMIVEWVEGLKGEVMDGWTSMAQIIGNVANGIANARGNWAALGATILTGIAQMVPKIQAVIKATKVLAAAKKGEAVAGAIATSQTVPFPGNLIAMATSVGAVLATIAPFVGSFARGTGFIANDGMAMVHKGEEIRNKGGVIRDNNSGGQLVAVVSGSDLHFVMNEFDRRRGNSL